MPGTGTSIFLGGQVGFDTRISWAEGDGVERKGELNCESKVCDLAPPTRARRSPVVPSDVRQHRHAAAAGSASAWFEPGAFVPFHHHDPFDSKVNVEITLPPPLSFFPGFLLRQAGSLVLRAVAAQILPRFTELVAEDYRRWARGLPRYPRPPVGASPRHKHGLMDGLTHSRVREP